MAIEDLERLIRIEEQTKAIKETVEQLMVYQKEQNGSVALLKTEMAVLKSEVLHIKNSPPETPKQGISGKVAAGWAAAASGVAVAILEYFKR